MLDRAKKIVAQLNQRGFEKATIYDPPGVEGTGYIYVLPHGDKPDMYGLPKEASISPLVSLWKGPVKLVGSVVLWASLLGAFLQLILFGPIKVGKKEKKEE
jgi:formate dehydrogenase iron-sulfur subunit